MPKEYDVGYGKPPVNTRFKKGQSGNPKGRPKGSTSLHTLINTVLAQKVPVMLTNGESELMAMKQLMVKTLFANACKGKNTALAFQLIAEAEKQFAAQN